MRIKCNSIDRMLVFTGKICKKLHLKNYIYKFADKSSKEKIYDKFDYMDILKKTSLSPAGTGVINRSTTWNKNKKYDVQIIIPMYNAETYMYECITSLIQQKTNYLWQAIIVNDGSTDYTGCFLEKYKYDKRFNIINVENGGAAKARNIGISLLEAEYVMFLDADDYLEENAIEVLMNAAIATKSDVVEGGFYDFKKNKRVKNEYPENKTVEYPVNELRGFPWGKVVKADLFKNIQFPDGYWYEDSIISFLLYPMCNNAMTIKDVVYNYRRNPQGASYIAAGKPKSVDTCYITGEMISSAKKLNINLEVIYDLTLGHIAFSGTRTALLNKKIRLAAFSYFCDITNENFKLLKTRNEKLALVEKALKEKNFALYESVARLW